MIRSALVAMLMVPGPAESAMSLYLASDPVTHSDGSVTWNPPERFDHPFDGEVTIRRMPQVEVMEACRRLFAEAGMKIPVGPKQKGCAVFKGEDGAIIVIDKPYGGSTPEDVIRHERGHLNGWPEAHPE